MMKRKRFHTEEVTGKPSQARHRVRDADVDGTIWRLGLTMQELARSIILEEEYERFLQDAVKDVLFAIEDAGINIGIDPTYNHWPALDWQN